MKVGFISLDNVGAKLSGSLIIWEEEGYEIQCPGRCLNFIGLAGFANPPRSC